jgi:hypothetical protein
MSALPGTRLGLATVATAANAQTSNKMSTISKELHPEYAEGW